MSVDRNPMREALPRLSAMLFAPAAATRDLGTRQVLSLGAVVFTGYFILSAVALPFGLKLLGPDDASLRPSWGAIGALLILQTVVTATMLSARWLFVAYVVWAFASAWGRSVPFIVGVGVVVLAEAPRLLENAFTLALIVLRSSPIESALDLRPPIGLNLFFAGLSPLMDAILNQVNLFQCWSVVLLGLGVKSVFRTTATAALLLASGLWLVGLSVRFSFAGS
jgi:hypothetical protein